MNTMTDMTHSCTGLHGLRTPHVTADDLADLYDPGDTEVVDLTAIERVYGWST